MMEQREKLIELIGNFTDDLPLRDIRSVAFDEKFADFLLENGVVVLPCRLHEPIYSIEDGEIFDDVPYEVNMGTRSDGEESLLYACIDGFDFYGDEVGKTVFLTEEEAEKALAEQGSGDE